MKSMVIIRVQHCTRSSFFTILLIVQRIRMEVFLEAISFTHIAFTHRWVNRLGRPPQGLGVAFVVSAPRRG